MSHPTQDSDAQKEHVQIDMYGIKATFKASTTEEAPPSSIEDVKQRIRTHLLRIAVAPTQLVADALEGAARLIRGITGLPSAINARLSKAHVQAEMREGTRQQELESQDALPNAKMLVEAEQRRQELLNRLNSILDDQRSKGHDGVIVPLPDDVILVVIGTQEEARGEIEAATIQAVSASKAVERLLPE